MATKSKSEGKEKQDKSDAKEKTAPKKKIRKRNQIRKGPNGGMQLVLTEDVEHLGKQGDVVEVKPGYGRNYLVPYGKAVIPSEHNLRLLERHKVRVQQAKEARVADLEALAKQIQAIPGVTIEAAATEGDHLYGSVGPGEIAKGLRSKNLMVDADMVMLENPIKEIGLFAVELNLGYGIKTEVRVAVVRAEERS